jgi:ParB family chromosome partitioning protein
MASKVQSPSCESFFNRCACDRDGDAMCEVMNEIKKDELDHVTIKNEVLRKYFPKSYTPKQMQDTIIRLLEKWQRSKQRDMER